MIQIKEEYETIMKRSLEKHVDVSFVTFDGKRTFLGCVSIFQGDTSGNYRKILLELLKDPSQRVQKAGNGKPRPIS